jgi:hypothetical protein
MVAHPGPDMLISALTCEAAVIAKVRCRQPRRHACPVDTGGGRLLAVVCAKYVPKFQPHADPEHGPRIMRAASGAPCHCRHSPRQVLRTDGATATRSVADGGALRTHHTADSPTLGTAMRS